LQYGIISYGKSRKVNVEKYCMCSVQGFGSGSVSGSRLDPYSIGPVDPDPYSETGSGSGSRRAKMTQKRRKKFMF
jgi:hypothetical protein